MSAEEKAREAQLELVLNEVGGSGSGVTEDGGREVQPDLVEVKKSKKR